jgi:hypothetical protein
LKNRDATPAAGQINEVITLQTVLQPSDDRGSFKVKGGERSSAMCGMSSQEVFLSQLLPRRLCGPPNAPGPLGFVRIYSVYRITVAQQEIPVFTGSQD